MINSEKIVKRLMARRIDAVSYTHLMLRADFRRQIGRNLQNM